MPNLALATCGTSLLTNLAGKQRGLMCRRANDHRPGHVPGPDREVLAALIKAAGRRLGTSNATERAPLSAEINGLLRNYDGGSGPIRDAHWLIATHEPIILARHFT